MFDYKFNQHKTTQGKRPLETLRIVATIECARYEYILFKHRINSVILIDNVSFTWIWYTTRNQIMTKTVLNWLFWEEDEFGWCFSNLEDTHLLPLLNINTIFPTMAIPSGHLIFIMGIPILVGQNLYIETTALSHLAGAKWSLVLPSLASIYFIWTKKTHSNISL